MNYLDSIEYSEEYYLPKELHGLPEDICKKIWNAAHIQWQEITQEDPKKDISDGTFLGTINSSIGTSKLLRGTYRITPKGPAYGVTFVFYDTSGREITEEIHSNDNPTCCMALCHEDALKRLALLYKGESHLRQNTLIKKTKDLYKERIKDSHTFL